MHKLVLISFLLFIFISSNAQSMIVAHQEIKPSEATLPLGVFTTNSLGLHIEDSLARILRNLYALNGEPITQEQISLKHNPVIRLQIVSRQVKPISSYIESGIQKLLQDYALYEKMVYDTLVDVIVVTDINAEQSHSDIKVSKSGLDGKGMVFDNSSLSTICWKLSNNSIHVKVSDKLLLKERLTMYIPDEARYSKAMLEIMREAGIKCSTQQLPLQKIVD